MTDIVLIVLVLLVVGVGLWWLLGGTKKEAPPAVERRETEAAPRPDATLERVVVPPDPEMLGTPMQATFAPPVGSATAPVDAPPPRPAAAPPSPGATVGAAPDDLTVMKGVGPKLATLLASLGVTRFDQIAAWSDADLDRIDAQLGNFKGRARRDQWIEQAGYLSKGDRAGFEARFGKIEG